MIDAEYVLYYAPDNASLIIRLVLEEMGVPYRTRLVDRRANEQQSKEYRALNPAGQIPTLMTREGPISETAAILLWLADEHRCMAPQLGDAERAPFLKWLFFTSNTLQSTLRMLFYPEKYVGTDTDAIQHLAANTQASLKRSLQLLDAVADAHPQWLSGNDTSVLDYYLACCMRWCAIYPEVKPAWFSLADYPALTNLLHRIETRPAVVAARIAEGLGEYPFTAPQRPQPPEGSAL